MAKKPTSPKKGRTTQSDATDLSSSETKRKEAEQTTGAAASPPDASKGLQPEIARPTKKTAPKPRSQPDGTANGSGPDVKTAGSARFVTKKTAARRAAEPALDAKAEEDTPEAPKPLPSAAPADVSARAEEEASPPQEAPRISTKGDSGIGDEPAAAPVVPMLAAAEEAETAELQPGPPAEDLAAPSWADEDSSPEMVPEPPPETTLAPALTPYSPPPRPSLFIVHISPELAAVAKVGGLADVVFGLTRELAIRGNHVEIILPKYDSMRYDQIYDLQEVYNDLWVPWYEGSIHCTVFFGFVHGRKCFFIEPHSADNFFNRGSIYGFNDDVARYAFFSRAAIEFLWKAGKHPDVIHCHDWQTALVPVFLYEFYQPMGMTRPRVCMTIHNFAHQGITGGDLLRATGLHRPERFLDLTRMGDKRHPGALNLLKGGIVYSNFVTTVSPRYAFETKDQGQGFGLEPTLHAHHIKYGGVVNGIDYDVWNPEVDRHIPVQYGIENIERKYDNKGALRNRLMLADNEKAIVAFIGRLDPQKGLELVRHAIFYCLERGAQFVLLGSSPDQRINNDFWGLKQMLNDSPDCHLEIGFDEDLSHLIYAGADMMLVPSRFEPCGLTQLISLRYGTIPIVREVGGLADTVFDKDHSHHPLHERNGYCFRDYDNRGLESALGRAIACYRQHPDHFRELMKNAMRADYSWNNPGQDYLNIYDYIRDA